MISGSSWFGMNNHDRFNLFYSDLSIMKYLSNLLDFLRYKIKVFSLSHPLLPNHEEVLANFNKRQRLVWLLQMETEKWKINYNLGKDVVEQYVPVNLKIFLTHELHLCENLLVAPKPFPANKSLL